MTPPSVLTRTEPTHPGDAHGSGDVGLVVTVGRDGNVVAAEVYESTGRQALDDAALEAVRLWRFEPATRNGAAVPSKIRVLIQVHPPSEVDSKPIAQPTKSAPGAAATPSVPPPATNAEALDVRIKGARTARTDGRGASNFVIERDVLDAAPAREGADVLRRAPGLTIGRADGLAVAHRYTLRGFDADHGQDIAFRVGGLPINLPSHIHGQGYADLGFLIGETVERMHVMEGVYDPRQGDFAVAGSIDLDLGVAERGWTSKSSYGSFDTFRQLAIWAPLEAPDETFGAASYERTDGFGENRDGAAASAIFQARFGDTSKRWTYRVIGFAHGARANLAGVVRADDVEQGRLGFYDVYPYPTAQRQNALAMRAMLGVFADHTADAGARAQVGAWIGYDNFRLQQNLTGFVQTSRTLENVAGRGDLIEQQNRTLSLGLTSHYRTQRVEPTTWARGAFELGFDTRLDIIEQAQNLLDASARNQTWDRRVDASIHGGDIGVWGDIDWSLPYVRVRVGIRATTLFYDVDDRLGNFVPLTRPDESFIVGFRRSAFGVSAGPRTSIEVRPLDWLAIRTAYGEGFRSPQARTLEDGEQAPFTKVRSGDLGVRLSWDERLELAVAGFLTHLSDDVAFDAREGRLERIGASRRLGGVLYMTSRPAPWLVASTSLTVVDAALLEPPPPTAEDPQPAFVEGQQLPFVPPVVARVDLGARHRLVRDIGGRDLNGRLGAGASYLWPRPLPFSDTARPVTLIDAGTELAWGPLTLGFDVFNLLNSEYAASEFSFPSDWEPQAPRRRVPARHVAAGAPISWLASLEVSL